MNNVNIGRCTKMTKSMLELKRITPGWSMEGGAVRSMYYSYPYILRPVEHRMHTIGSYYR